MLRRTVEAKRKEPVELPPTLANPVWRIVFGIEPDGLARLTVEIASSPPSEQFELRANRRIWL